MSIWAGQPHPPGRGSSTFALPPVQFGRSWQVALNTASATPVADVPGSLRGRGKLQVDGLSAVVLRRVEGVP